jgi:hypothetical protein
MENNEQVLNWDEAAKSEQSPGQIGNFDEDLLTGLRVDPSYNEPVLHQVLRIAVYDEFHAYETYKKTIEKFGVVEPFANIMQAEVRHYEALIPLLNKYGVPVPVNDWADKIEEPNNILEASEVGVAAEIDNVKMYDNLISYAKNYPDVVDILYRLQAASYNNHLPAFRQSVAGHSAMPVDINAIYNQYSTHDTIPAQEDMAAKMNEFNQMAMKLSTGELSQEDIMTFLGNTNLSFIGGALAGAVGTMIFSQMTKEESVQGEDQCL